MQNCIISNSNRGISIQIRDEGNVENVSFQNIMIQTRRFAECWWGCAEPIAITVADRDKNTSAGKISGIRFSNIFCDSENGVLVHGMPENCVEDIFFEKVQVTLSAKSKWKRGQYDLRPGLGMGIIERKSPGFFLENAEGVIIRDCRVKFQGDDLADFAQAIYAKNCRDLSLERFKGETASQEYGEVEICS